MIELLSNFHFIRPFWILGCVPVIILLVLMWRFKRDEGDWKNKVDSRFVKVLSYGKNTQSSIFHFVCISLFFILALIALAGPSWKKIEIPAIENQSATVLVWDLSPSMLAEDLKPNRLLRSRHKLKDYLSTKTDGLTALIVYSGDAHTVTPLTDDVRTISNLLDSLSPEIMPSRGSNIEQAYTLANSLIQNHAASEGSIIVLTDGISPEAEQELIKQYRSSKNKTLLWSIGTEAGAPIPVGEGRFARNLRDEIVIAKTNNASIAALAGRLRAEYVPFTANNDDLDRVKAFIASNNLSPTVSSQDTRQFDAWEEYGRFLLIPILLVFLISFRRGWLLSLVLVSALLQPQRSFASDWLNFFKTKDQQAQSAMDLENYAEATELYEQQDWKAAAAYKAGNFEQAKTLYEGELNAEGQYNLGNTLVKTRQYAEAIQAYERALEFRPRDEATLNNKAIAEKLLEAQEKQQEQSQSQESEQQDQGEQNNKGNSEQNSQEQSNNSSQNADSDSQEPSQDESDESNQSSSKDAKEKQETNSTSENTSSQSESGEHEQGQDTDKAINEEQQQALDQHYKATDEQHDNKAIDNNHSETAHQDENSDKQERSFLSAEQQQQNEEAQALEQWLRKVPDDPGQLMRNKFAQEYRDRRRQQNSRAWRKPPNEEDRW